MQKYNYTVKAYNSDYRVNVFDTVRINILANDEKDAIEKAKKLVERASYKVTNIRIERQTCLHLR